MNLGWLCMSWRQPATVTHAANAKSAEADLMRLISHLHNRGCVERLEKAAALCQREFRIFGLDAEEELVFAGSREVGRVEYGMVRQREPVECEHADKSRKRGAEHGAFEEHRHECGPGVEGLAADVDGISDNRDPVHERVSTGAAE